MKITSNKHGFVPLPLPRCLKIMSLPNGFTIVELLVVIVVIGILAAITIVSYTGISSRANVSALQSDLTNASNQLKMYQIDHSTYPTSIDASNCPLDSLGVVDNSYCLKPSSGNSLLYSSNNNSNPQTFSLYAINNSTSTKYRTTDSSSPIVATPVVATGGTITNVGGYRIHTFTTVGTSTFTVSSGDNVEALVVGGGGGGGGQGVNDGSGGGGAGGLIYNSAYSIMAGSYTVTVGNGGAGVVAATPGNQGGNSVFGSLTSIGGGGGGSESSQRSGLPGGSGGGAGGYSPSYIGGVGTVGQGNNGGANIMPITPNYGGGGGGGAGSVGIGGTIQADSVSNHISGGNGLSYSISGTSMFYAGGGGNGGGYGGYGGYGGSNSGGKGGNSVAAQAAGTSGVANTGGGGGGAGGQLVGGVGNSGSGGSGIVIIRYPN